MEKQIISGPIGIIERYKNPKAVPTNVALPPALGYILPNFPNTNATGKIITLTLSIRCKLR